MSNSIATERPGVWSLVSSIGLVYMGPLLLLIMIGLLTGSLDLGTPELTLLMVIWCVGIPWVIVRWVKRRKAPPSSV
jgi:positive regulator of sigma E activity